MKKPKLEYIVLVPFSENNYTSSGSVYMFAVKTFATLKAAQKESKRWAGFIVAKALRQDHEIRMKKECS